jgi:hypothetical protein
MTLEFARNASNIANKFKNLVKPGGCDSVKNLPESNKLAGFSDCEIMVLHFYARSKYETLSPNDITDFLIQKKKYDGRRKNSFKQNIEKLFNYYRTVYPTLGDFNEMIKFSQSLSHEYKIPNFL